MHHAGERPCEGSVLQVSERLRDLAHAGWRIEESIAGRSDLGVQDESFGRSAQMAAKASFQGADRHLRPCGQLVHAKGLVDVVVHEIDQL